MVLLEPTNLLLLACALLYGLVGEPADGAILLLFVAAIVLLDQLQRRRSDRALEELARLSAPRARVRRGDHDLEIPAAEVRIGDRLRLEEGDRVAADGRLLEGVGLWLDESLLTGESLPVVRQRPGEPVRAGSLVAAGRGWVAVEAVADSTELGQIGRQCRNLQPPATRLQRHTRRLTTRLTLVALLLCAGLTLLQGMGSGDWSRALLAGLALALAVLPNEIPVVLALFLALGALRLARCGVLARWPAAVESLGSATVLAVDKTGTLTENRMAVERLLTWPELLPWHRGTPLEEPWHGLVERAVLASRPDPVDAMEQAIQRLASGQLEGTEHLHPEWPLEREFPLQGELLVVSRQWRDPAGQHWLAAKGAPEAIADLCHLEPASSRLLLEAADQLASEGLRVLAVAAGLRGSPRHGESPPTAAVTRPAVAAGPGAAANGEPLRAELHDFLFEPVGLIGLADPLREDVPAAIATARRAGVRVVMITGDGPRTARAIADQAGLPPGEVVCGGPSAAADRALMAQVTVFARVRPLQKLELVRALQAAGEVVAMTGDGVNDAAALKAADIGVAMGSRGTAVAREAADLVLLRDRFSDLVAALALGRRVEANLQTALAYTLAIHLPIAALALVPLLGKGSPLILLPLHIALLHLVIDPACTVVFEAMAPPQNLLLRPPRPPQAPLISPASWRQALGQGLALLAAALTLTFWPGIDPLTHRSLAFSLLLLTAGGLVWLNGNRRDRLTTCTATLTLALWGLTLFLDPLRRALALAPLRGEQLALLLLAVGLALLLAALAGGSLQANEGEPSPMDAARSSPVTGMRSRASSLSRNASKLR
jgi:Ca2+-transporting ATPase